MKSLKLKIMFVISLMVVILFGASFYLAENQVADILEDNIIHSADQVSDSNAKILEEWFSGINNEMKLLTQSDTVQSMEWDRQFAYLRRAMEELDDIETFYTANRQGHFNITSGGEGSIADREYFKEIIKTQEPVVSSPIYNKDTGELVVAVVHPIFNQGYFNGILGATVKLDRLSEIASGMNINGEGRGFIIDNQNNMLAHPEKEFLGNNKFYQQAGTELKNILDKMSAGEDLTLRYSQGGKNFLISFAPVPGTDWSLATEVDEKIIFSVLDNLTRSFVLYAVIGILLALLIAYLIARYVAEPIKIVSQEAEKVADGNLIVKKGDNRKVNKRKDEIGTLIESFKFMRSNLRQMIIELIESIEQMSASSEELNATGTQLGKAASEVSSSVEDIASGTEEQTAMVGQTQENINGLVLKVKDINQLSDDMDELAAEVMKSIEAGNKSLDNSADRIKNVKENSLSAADMIYKLGDLSEEIGGIVDLIKGISSQTNLLALNAAIEAARAGEAGRGFSVVADEIRQLAEESSDATDRISELVEEVQNNVSSAVKEMDSSVDIVAESVESIKYTGHSFNYIQEKSAELRDIIEKISQSLEEILGDSDQVDKAVKNIAHVTRESASKAENVAASAEEQTAATEEIAAASEDLAEMAEKLNQLVGRFEV
ncbi:MAG: methyl-accepting chemotaxis protein [Bacillota bacterium]